MDLILAYLAGLLTLINPCVLPILPIMLAGSLQTHRFGPVAMAGGMAVSFVVLGMTLAVAGRALGISETTVGAVGAWVMIGFGIVLVVPKFSARFATATAGLSAGADARVDGLWQGGLGGQALTGVLMGAVWSPCIGPTLGAAIGLASQGENLIWAGAIMTFFALGVATIILALGYGARSVIQARQARMRRIAEVSRPIMGAVFIAMGAALLFHLPRYLEIWALDHMPDWLIAFSVSI